MVGTCIKKELPWEQEVWLVNCNWHSAYGQSIVGFWQTRHCFSVKKTLFFASTNVQVFASVWKPKGLLQASLWKQWTLAGQLQVSRKHKTLSNKGSNNLTWGWWPKTWWQWAASWCLCVHQEFSDQGLATLQLCFPPHLLPKSLLWKGKPPTLAWCPSRASAAFSGLGGSIAGILWPCHQTQPLGTALPWPYQCHCILTALH